MTDTESTTESKYRQLVGIVQCLLLPMLGVAGAVAVTGLPGRDPAAMVEVSPVQEAAIFASFCSALIVAIVLWPNSATDRKDWKRHFVVLSLALLGGHLLWVQPIWGFHHDMTLGVLAWLFIGGEDGFWMMPGILTLPLTTLVFVAYLRVLRAVNNSAKAT